MAITAQELNVILSARDKQFTRAMDRAQKRVERFAKKSTKDLSKTTKAMNGLTDIFNRFGGVLSAGVLTAGLTRQIDNATRLAKELTNLSNLAGTNVEDFQRFAFAAKTVGIEQDKVADILKDVNDKFGDFLVTGAGPLADFFENIAPRVGVTADAFRGLSSDQALGLYVKTLQEAGVNQQQLTFFMEALANDATVLTPLLLNNGEAMDVLRDKADQLGVVLSADLVSDASDLREEFEQIMSKMTSSAEKFFMTVALGFAEIFNVQTDRSKLADLTKEMDRVMERLSTMNVGLLRYRQSLQTAERLENETMIHARKQQIKVLENTMRTELERFEKLRKEINALKALIGEEGVPPLEVTITDGVVTGSKNITQVRGAVVGLSKDMEELHRFTTTLESAFEDTFMAAIDGASSFKDVLRSSAQQIIRELYRVLVVQRLVNAAMGFLGVSTGNPTVGSVPGNAAGGAVYAGQPTMVGEHGRELFVPSTSGRILSVPQSKAALGGSGEGVTVNQTINITTGVQQTVRNEIKTLLPQIAETAKSAVADSKRRGGSYGRAFT